MRRARFGSLARDVRAVAAEAAPSPHNLLLTALIGAVLGAGVFATRNQLPIAPEPRIARLTSALACDPAATAIGVRWRLDTAAALPPVTGVWLNDVPAECAALPITVSLLDVGGLVLFSASRPGLVDGSTGPQTLLFDFGSHPVAVPPIGGLLAAIPDPAGVPIAVLAGSDVTVAAVDPASGAAISVNFDQVLTAGGELTATILLAGAPDYVTPAGFELTDPAVVFDLATTASFIPPVDVCADLPSSAVPTAGTPGLFHWDAAIGWQDVTSSWDPATGRLCGTVSTFSPFAAGVATAIPPSPPPSVAPASQTPAPPIPTPARPTAGPGGTVQPPATFPPAATATATRALSPTGAATASPTASPAAPSVSRQPASPTAVATAGPGGPDSPAMTAGAVALSAVLLVMGTAVIAIAIAGRRRPPTEPG